MHPDTVEVIVHRLRALVDEKPQQAMDELESLVKQLSVRELTEILRAVYVEISGEMGIDWHFTALQWKLGNGARRTSSRDLSRSSVYGLVLRISGREWLWFRNAIHHLLAVFLQVGVATSRCEGGTHYLNLIKPCFRELSSGGKTRREWWALQDLNL